MHRAIHLATIDDGIHPKMFFLAANPGSHHCFFASHCFSLWILSGHLPLFVERIDTSRKRVEKTQWIGQDSNLPHLRGLSPAPRCALVVTALETTADPTTLPPPQPAPWRPGRHPLSRCRVKLGHRCRGRDHRASDHRPQRAARAIALLSQPSRRQQHDRPHKTDRNKHPSTH